MFLLIDIEMLSYSLIVLRVDEIDDRNKTNSLFFLLNLDSKQRHHDKKIYNKNETWSIDHCTTCVCRSGLVDCATC
jgi:hypothetical protein